jgi:hypothetical protein
MEDNKFQSMASARHLGSRLRDRVKRLMEIRDAVRTERHWLLLGACGFEDQDALVLLMNGQELYMEGMLGMTFAKNPHALDSLPSNISHLPRRVACLLPPHSLPTVWPCLSCRIETLHLRHSRTSIHRAHTSHTLRSVAGAAGRQGNPSRTASHHEAHAQTSAHATGCC